jgi:hypothetical protein
MSTSKPRSPLTPADSEYLGLDADEYHWLRWRSQTSEGTTYGTWGRRRRVVGCTCPGWRHRGSCKHALSFDAALAYHLDPPPADPGGAAPSGAEPPLGVDPYDDREHVGAIEEAWTRPDADPGFATPLDPDDEGPFVGGAALEAAQADADDEADAWAAELRTVRHGEGLRALYGPE